MPYRNKTFVSFDGDTDMHYYRLMTAWHQSDRSPFEFYNAHDLTQARDSSLESTIKASLSERLRNSKVFVLLIGESTRYLRKFVRWEIEQAITRQLPIIGINLNGMRAIDEERCPPILRPELAVYVSFNAAIMQHALETWPEFERTMRSQGRTGPFFYNPEVYRGLNL